MASIPDEIKQAVAALDNEYRWRIIESLLESEELSYTELLRALDIKKGNLTHHLNTLTRGSLVEKYSKERLGGRYDSYYALALFGQDVIRGLVHALSPTAPARPGSAATTSTGVVDLGAAQSKFGHSAIVLMAMETEPALPLVTRSSDAGTILPKPPLNATALQ